MRRFLGTAIFFCSAVFAYQSFQTSQPNPEVQEQARRIACQAQGAAKCLLQSDDMRSAELNSFGHRYQWSTPGGERWVNCRRQWIVLGAWSCELG